MIMTGAGSDGVQEGVTMHSKESCSGPTHVQRTPGADPTQSGTGWGCVGSASDVCRTCAKFASDVCCLYLHFICE